MRNYLRKYTTHVFAALGSALSALAVTSMVAFSLTVPPTIAPRYFNTQQTHYTRFTLAFNSCVYVSLVCSVKIGAVPYNAYILRGRFMTTTTWNAGTSASVGLGTVTPGVNIAASQAVTTAGNDTAFTIAAAGAGIGVTGNGVTPTGLDGGFDLFATITIVGALPTAGLTVFVIEWIAPNDGSCGPQTLGFAAPAC
jgi:hypothetical protein